MIKKKSSRPVAHLSRPAQLLPPLFSARAPARRCPQSPDPQAEPSRRAEAGPGTGAAGPGRCRRPADAAAPSVSPRAASGWRSRASFVRPQAFRAAWQSHDNDASEAVTDSRPAEVMKHCCGRSQGHQFPFSVPSGQNIFSVFFLK